MEVLDLPGVLRGLVVGGRRDLPGAARAGLRQALVGAEPRPAGAPSRRLDRVIAVVGLVLVVVAAALALFAAASGQGGPRLLLLVASVLVPLVLAARFPLWGWRIAWLAGILVPLLPHHARLDPGQIVVLLLLFGIAAARYGRPTSWAIWVITLVPLWVWVGGSDWRASLAATAALTLLCIAIDALSGWRRTHLDLLAQTERTQTEAEKRAVLEERARIAREMHDVLAHHLSMIAVQTETAPYRLQGLSNEVCTEFAVLNDAARAALTDTRALLGALHSEQRPERCPQPVLTDVPELVGAARRAGVAVELRMPARTDALRPVIASSAYRIVQEALSNAARHAPAAAVTVTVERHLDRLGLQVRNSQLQTPPNTSVADGTGHGLAGMRERVALLEGTLAAGPADDGGYVVAAVLPTGAGTR